MQKRAAVGVCALAVLALAHGRLFAADAPLTVVSAGPTGELTTHAQSNEIRVVFSEPMVALGRIPNPVTAPFFHIAPEVHGTFRWSGTTILIFTPNPPNALPYATTFRVTIDGSAAAVSGRKLAAPYSFSFTTPTVRLLSTQWYRKTNTFNGSPVVALRFNQPVRPADIAAHTTFRFEKHQWTPPALSPAAEARLRATEPNALAAFNAKVAATLAAASADAPIQAAIAADWNKLRFPPSPDLVVLELTTKVPPQSLIRVLVDQTVPSPAGPERPPKPQSYGLEVEPALFVRDIECRNECDPDQANAIVLSGIVPTEAFAKSLTVVDVTDPGREKRVASGSKGAERTDRLDRDSRFTIEDGGFDPQPPARTYAMRIDASLKADDGQTLGYSWIGVVENWHQRAFTSFGGGHGVWEAASGPALPFYARNFADVQWWAAPVSPSDLMPAVLRQQSGFDPPDAGHARRIAGPPDTIQSPGIDLSEALKSAKTGLVWAAVQDGSPIARAKPAINRATAASLVQVTNLGVSVKDSPQNTLVLVTRLDTGAAVSGATVSIIDRTNRLVWRGTTDRDGLALAPNTPLRSNNIVELSFIVTAEKDGDIAYVGSDWTEGTSPYLFDTFFDLNESRPQVRGSVFTDRGVYKLGEEVHFKAILRHDTVGGMRLLDADAPIKIVVRDAHNKVVDSRSVRLNAWSSAEWTFRVPAEGALGTYSIAAGPEVSNAAAAKNGDDTFGLDYSRGAYVRGTFLVAAYRRPDFRVDATLTADNPIAGAALHGGVKAQYLFGAAMVKRPIKWTYTRVPAYSPPPSLTEHFTDSRFTFVGCCFDRRDRDELGSDDATLTANGQFARELETAADLGLPYRYTFEGEVEDLSRQRIAGRASILVHPAPWYIGVREAPDFVDSAKGFDTEIVAVSPDGRIVPDVSVQVTLQANQWYSARRAEGHGFYTWDSQRTAIEGQTVTITTASKPVPVHLEVPQGGYFIVRAVANADEGRYAVTQTSFYALGNGYTAWERFDDNRVNLVPERATYKPGETARIMIQSPWERATALLTTEREGVRTHQRFELTSTQQTVTVPVTEADIPNVFVSVMLIKGRTIADGAAPSEAVVSERAGGLGDARHPRQAVINDGSDPGKPAFRLGYAELRVEDSTKKLAVAVKANKVEYRPASVAKIDVDVKDKRGAPTASEVTLWAVDYGVLSLTGFRTPSIVDSVYVEKALQVVTTDNRERLISRRVTVPKGTEDGGGGGNEKGPGPLRTDFRVLAFWVGSVVTDSRGHATTTVTLPESLTTYRIMAVAGDRASRFGSADSDIRINKPVLLRAAYPRFLAVGDSAYFGSVVASQLKEPGTAVVSIRSLDPNVLEIRGDARKSVDVGAGGSAEVRFDAVGKAIGRARVQMSVRLRDEEDAFEDIVPVEVLVSPETVAAYGQAAPDARERLTVPQGVVPGFGGLHLELSSTAMVGLNEGAQYLLDYPFGCAEQRSSRTLALLLAEDLGGAFKLTGYPADLKNDVQRSVTELERFQCPNGGIAFWPGECGMTSPYLTAYVMHVMQTARAHDYVVTPGVLDRGYAWLQAQLGQEPPLNEGWQPWFTAWQAFALKVLFEGGHPQDSVLNRLYTHRDTMPIFGLSYMVDAMAARHETGARVDDLKRRIANGVLPEAGGSHVEELNDPYLLWFWNSNVRSTAIALSTLVRTGGGDGFIAPMVRWLLAARKNGRWGNTQENALALEALVDYYRKFEHEPPSFTATAAFGASELTRDRFEGRSTEARVKDVPMAALVASAPAGASRDLTFHREGTGTLFYATRLQYAVDSLFQQGLDSGFAVSRQYNTVDANGKPLAASTTFQAGDLVRVTLSFELTKERRFVAVVDPLPAGLEPVESWFETTAGKTAEAQEQAAFGTGGWTEWWRRGGFDHVERHDDRVMYFATRLSEGHHETSYLARATTAGTFRTAPAHAEEMYQPEVFGRTATAVIEVKR